MVAPVQKDSLTDYQVALATYLRITSPIAGMFTGSEIKPNPNARSIRVPDIRVDDYIVDADISRIGADHYSGSEYTAEWKNGIPPIEWRTYSMSRHRSFGFTVFDEQLRYSPIKNIVQEYTGRKMQTTVLRDHDKYCLLASISGHMTGKLVARTPADTPGPVTADARMISCTGNAADYKWVAEPGEDYDNEIQPSFATIKGMYLNDADQLSTLDALTLLFSDNWFDSNFGNNERFLLVTSALELVYINALIDAGADREKIVLSLYKTQPFHLLKLWGRLMSRLKLEESVRLAYATASIEDFVQSRSNPEDIPAILEKIRGNFSAGVYFAVLFPETAETSRVFLKTSQNGSAGSLAAAIEGAELKGDTLSFPIPAPADLRGEELLVSLLKTAIGTTV